MTGPLPFRPSIDHTPKHRSVIDLADDPSPDVLRALGTETVHAILSVLSDRAATTTDLAECVDTSLQNIGYHLKKLCDGDIVTPIGTWYSSKGTEMTVYALTSERIEIRLASSESSPTEVQTYGNASSSPDRSFPR